jgi:hypothetical protein
MKVPKYFLNHKAVKEVENVYGVTDQCYKFCVVLKDDWVYSLSRAAGGQCLNLNTIADFKWASPILKKDWKEDE